MFLYKPANVTKKEIEQLKREVKAVTGRNIKDIEEIKMWSDTEITFGYYKNNYDKATNKKSYETIERN